jgi:hypothetical protein
VQQVIDIEQAFSRLDSAIDTAKLRAVALRRALLAAALSGRLTWRASETVEETANV